MDLLVVASLIIGSGGLIGSVGNIANGFITARASQAKAELEGRAQVSSDIQWYVKNLKEDVVEKEKSLSVARTENESLQGGLASAKSRIESLEATIRELNKKIRQMGAER